MSRRLFDSVLVPKEPKDCRICMCGHPASLHIELHNPLHTDPAMRPCQSEHGVKGRQPCYCGDFVENPAYAKESEDES